MSMIRGVALLLILAGGFALPAFSQTSRKHNNTERGQGYFDMVIPAGGSLSDGIILGRRCIVTAIQTPATLTATTLSFQFSADGTTYGEAKDEYGSFYTVIVGTSLVVLVDSVKWLNIGGFKVRTGTAASPTTEADARTLRFLCGKIE